MLVLWRDVGATGICTMPMDGTRRGYGRGIGNKNESVVTTVEHKVERRGISNLQRRDSSSSYSPSCRLCPFVYMKPYGQVAFQPSLPADALRVVLYIRSAACLPRPAEALQYLSRAKSISIDTDTITISYTMHL